jgi:hypothetical protein
VLTAAHVGQHAMSVNLGGVGGYPIQKVRLKDPGNPSVETDLMLMQNNYTDPPLPKVTISAAAPPNGSQVVMTGHGYSRRMP